jgi:hypothetical protein
MKDSNNYITYSIWMSNTIANFTARGETTCPYWKIFHVNNS